eukprot:GHVN01041405.1.p1 GENE.GHVN01041405.1~~GHVN01041405.1.p1  ORF type:complete len:114 (+),score=2.76 GHVN01041405.1:411-752(+)
MVPRKMGEEAFWRSYFWGLSGLVEQLRHDVNLGRISPGCTWTDPGEAAPGGVGKVRRATTGCKKKNDFIKCWKSSNKFRQFRVRGLLERRGKRMVWGVSSFYLNIFFNWIHLP